MVRAGKWKTALAAAGATAGVLGLAALATRKSKPAAPAPAPSRAVRIALIGDSYAVGLGPELAKLLPDFQCQGDGYTCTGVNCEGHAGTSTVQWVNHAPQCGRCGDWLTTLRPTVVLVSLGVNDGNAANPANYQAIVSALHGIGARAIWIEPPAAVSVPSVRGAIASLGVPTVPATQTPLAADHLHPVSYAQWAREVVQTVASQTGIA